MKQGIKTIVSVFLGYLRDQSAALMVAFALMAPVVVGAVGMSLDYAQAYLVQQRLAQALDAAALAAAASETDEAAVEQKINDFLEANYPEEKLGTTIEPSVTIDGNSITVDGSAYYTTFFLGVIGVTEITVEASTTVERAVQGVEVVLVMDNTGSMATNDNISALRTAATNFVYIMYGIDEDDVGDIDDIDDLATNNRDYIKIGLVPYSTAVNVGPYGLGEDLEGDDYGEAFVNNPLGLDYDPNDSDAWHGCVLALDNPDDTTDNEGPWDMYRWCRDSDTDAALCGTCAWYWTWRGWRYYCFDDPVYSPNYICPETPITPLSTSPAELKTAIDTMEADGWTLGNLGMIWGERVISEDYPFEEGSAYGSDFWRKAVVLMTDGVNTMGSPFSAYGDIDDHDVSASDLDDRLADVCTNLKNNGVLVYTVTFEAGVDEDTKQIYEDCATSESYYKDAPEQADLIAVFEEISRELSNLRITN